MYLASIPPRSLRAVARWGRRRPSSPVNAPCKPALGQSAKGTIRQSGMDDDTGPAGLAAEDPNVSRSPSIHPNKQTNKQNSMHAFQTIGDVVTGHDHPRLLQADFRARATHQHAAKARVRRGRSAQVVWLQGDGRPADRANPHLTLSFGSRSMWTCKATGCDKSSYVGSIEA